MTKLWIRIVENVLMDKSQPRILVYVFSRLKMMIIINIRPLQVRGSFLSIPPVCGHYLLLKVSTPFTELLPVVSCVRKKRL